MDDIKDDWDGYCNDTENSFTLTFANNWQMWLQYTLQNKNEYTLDSIKFSYITDSALFPNITTDDANKPFTSLGSSLAQFPASKGNSYKCTSKTKIMLDDKVSFEFRNYQGQPFISKESKSKDFDTGELLKYLVLRGQSISLKKI